MTAWIECSPIQITEAPDSNAFADICILILEDHSADQIKQRKERILAKISISNEQLNTYAKVDLPTPGGP